uniref:Uncharacterized protein n=1 Tax=Naja naja TaxID=35670 RepID=A0A8C6YFS5_NAJNA
MIGSPEGVLLLLCVLFILFSSFQMYKKKGQLPPGPTPWPILGNLLQQDILPLNESYEKYGPIFTIWIGSKPLVVLCGYEMVKEALIDHAEEFSGLVTFPLEWGANGDFRNWKERRQFMLSTLRNFGMGKKQMSERVQEEAVCLVEEVGSMQGSPKKNNFICKKKLRRSFVLCKVTGKLDLELKLK